MPVKVSDYNVSVWLYILMIILAIVNFVIFLIGGNIRYGIRALFFLGFALLMTQNLLKYDMVKLIKKRK